MEATITPVPANLAMKAPTMSLADLIDHLTDLRDRRPDLAAEPVLLAYEYGDHHRTQALATVTEARLVEVYQTAYSETGLGVLRTDDEEDEPDLDQALRRIENHAVVLGLCSHDRGVYQDLEETRDEVVL